MVDVHVVCASLGIVVHVVFAQEYLYKYTVLSNHEINVVPSELVLSVVPSEIPVVLSWETHSVGTNRYFQQPGPHSLPPHEQPVHTKMVDVARQTDISGADLDGMEDSNTANIMCKKAYSQCLNIVSLEKQIPNMQLEIVNLEGKITQL